MNLTDEGLFFSYDNGFSYNKANIQDFVKFMLDLTIESCSFLIHSNRIIN